MPLMRALWTGIGRILQALPEFPTKGRWECLWFDRRDKNRVETRRLPGGALLQCSMEDFNEAWTWMRLHDRAQLETLQALLRPGDTFIDVGANIGVWALAAAAKVGGSGTVVPVEPNPQTYRKLQTNVDLNAAMTKWHPVQAAASKVPGEIFLELAEFAECCSVSSEPGENRVRVATIALDDLPEAANCAGLKVDVEGHELAVLEGATELLTRTHPWLCVEFNNKILQLKSLSAWPVHVFLTGLGYRPWLFTDAARRTSVPSLNGSFYTPDYVNLFYVHSDRE